MKKSLFVLGFLGAATVGAAGTRFLANVTVGSTFAFGSMGDARRSTDSLQYIGCSTSASASTLYATCYARDAAGHYASCYTYDANLIRVAETASSDSTIDFSWSGAGCRNMTITNDSRYSPRQP